MDDAQNIGNHASGRVCVPGTDEEVQHCPKHLPPSLWREMLRREEPTTVEDCLRPLLSILARRIVTQRLEALKQTEVASVKTRN